MRISLGPPPAEEDIVIDAVARNRGSTTAVCLLARAINLHNFGLIRLIDLSFHRFINKLFASVRYESIKFPKPLKNGHCGAHARSTRLHELRALEIK